METYSSPKDGYEVATHTEDKRQAMSDFVFTLWRPNKEIRGSVDNILAVYLCKHKHIPDSHQLAHYYFENGEILNETTELVGIRERERRI